MKQRGSGHYLGLFCVGLIGLAVFIVSVTLSLTFFQGITPPDKPWFPYFGLSLTEAGFLLWLGAFLWVKFHGFHTAVELIMVVASLLGIAATACTELFSLMPYVSIDIHAPFIANMVGIVLTGIFLANIVSVFVGVLALFSESNPGWFRGGGGGRQVAYSAQGDTYIAEQRGETARPLALRRRNDPKNEPEAAPRSLDNSEEIELPEEEEETPPIQSPVKRLPPLQMHQDDSFLAVFKDGISSLLPRRKSPPKS